MRKYIDFQKEHIKTADIILLVYDVTDQESFDGIAYWFKVIKDILAEKKVVVSIIANKTDNIKERKVKKY